MRHSRSIPILAAVVTLAALAACAASAVTPLPDDNVDDDSGTRSDRGGGPGDPNPAEDTGTDARDASADAMSCLASEGPSPDLVINEVDYDTVGTTENEEFVEIFNRAAEPRNLDGIEVVFFNGGAAGKDHTHVDLAPFGPIRGGGYLVIGTRAFDAGAGITVIPLDQETIQNGPKDAIAIIDKVSHRVIDSISYEGALTEPCNLSEGTATTVQDSNDAGGSLIRFPNGTDTNNAASDWKFTPTPTPGADNQ